MMACERKMNSKKRTLWTEFFEERRVEYKKPNKPKKGIIMNLLRLMMLLWDEIDHPNDLGSYFYYMQ